MSVFLQSMVDELIMKKNGTRKKKPSTKKGPFPYMKRDGATLMVTLDEPEVEMAAAGASTSKTPTTPDVPKTPATPSTPITPVSYK